MSIQPRYNNITAACNENKQTTVKSWFIKIASLQVRFFFFFDWCNSHIRKYTVTKPSKSKIITNFPKKKNDASILKCWNKTSAGISKKTD